jgi:hypothetical protein
MFRPSIESLKPGYGVDTALWQTLIETGGDVAEAFATRQREGPTSVTTTAPTTTTTPILKRSKKKKKAAADLPVDTMAPPSGLPTWVPWAVGGIVFLGLTGAAVVVLRKKGR